MDNEQESDEPRCNLCEEIAEDCDCFHCTDCGKPVDEWCVVCDQCESCCVCDHCEHCEDVVKYANFVGDTAVCDDCISSYYTYCCDCEEYYPDDDDHSHDCECDAPLPSFHFPANGEGRISEDERLTVTLPKGTIDDEGLARIGNLVNGDLRTQWQTTTDRTESWYSRAASATIALEEVGDQWQGKRGNFTKRLSSALHKRGIALSPHTISEVGNIARQHSSSDAAWHVEVTRDLNQDASYFYHGESCWWGGFSESRCCLKSWGGIALRSFESDASRRDNPSGRAWIQPLNEDLEPTHDAINAHAYVVYNGYGELDGYTAPRVIAHLTGKTYRKIAFNIDHDGSRYVNGDNGYLIADAATCEETESLDFGEYDEHDTRDARALTERLVAV